jgi:transglutaminase-like putative cysteine protease
MKKNTWHLFIAGIAVLITVFSGCDAIISPTTYEPTPTKVRYDISYGYLVNSTGTGRYEIVYWCNTPEVLVGTTSYHLLYNQEYEVKTLVNNTFIHWNIAGKDEQTYELGLIVQAESESSLVADLNGESALTIKEIAEDYPEIVNQYTQLQANETLRFIDPYDPNIITIAETIYNNAETNNTFLLAKTLFRWLKENIQYQIHPNNEGVQPAATTLYNKVGDCDDLSFLYISLCRVIGIPARFIRGYLLTSYENGTAVAIAHAWVEVFVGGSVGHNGWIPVECACCTTSIETDINQNFGVETAFHLRLFTDDGRNESLVSMLSGISYVTYGQNRTIELQLFTKILNYQELESKKLVITRENTRYYE